MAATTALNGSGCAASMAAPHSRLYSADWASAQDEVKARQREEQQRVAEYNDRRAREREEAENAAERDRVAALQR